jgi:FG-GAP repeat
LTRPRSTLIVALAALAAALAGGAAVAAVVLLTRADDERDRAVEVAVGTAGLVRDVSGLLEELQTPFLAGDPEARSRAVRELRASERAAAQLIAAANEDTGGSDRTTLVNANQEIRRVARRVGDSLRRGDGQVSAEAERGLRDLDAVELVIEELAVRLPNDVGRERLRARLSKQPVDLPYTNVVLRGQQSNELAGAAVAAAGDVNGDGRDDVIVASPGSRTAHLVFGGDTPSEAELGTLDPSWGFSIGSLPVPEPFDFASDDTDLEMLSLVDQVQVSGIGDLDGDGLDDVAIGVPGASPDGVEASGSVYVVYGSDEEGKVDARALGTRGFRIDGPDYFWRLGQAVAGGGDLNGDDQVDLVVGGREHFGRQDFTAAQGKPVSWVVLGGERLTGVVRLDRRAAPTRGWRIGGVGSSLAVAGDTNGDGLDDLVGGDAYNRMEAPGYAAIVHGRRAVRTRIDTARARPGVVSLRVVHGRMIGSEVAAAGDQNRDGLADVAVVSHDLAGGARAHVVFGRRRPRPLRLDRMGSAGAAIELGRVADDNFWPATLALAGDVDGDKRQDIVVGIAPASRPNGVRYPAGARIVLGGTLRPGRSVDAVRATSGIVRIDAFGVRLTPSEYGVGDVGYSLAGVGDIDGDGLGDIAVGAPRADALDPDPTSPTPSEGAVYISYRRPPPGRGPLDGVVSQDGLGQVAVGLPEPRIETLLDSAAYGVIEDCGSIPANDARVRFLTTGGTVGRVEILGPGFRTAAGVQVGDPESAVEVAYGEGITREPNEYDPDGSYLSVSFDTGRKIVFETDGQQVTSIRAGRTPEVDFVEGCL